MGSPSESKLLRSGLLEIRGSEFLYWGWEYKSFIIKVCHIFGFASDFLNVFFFLSWEHPLMLLMNQRRMISWTNKDLCCGGQHRGQVFCFSYIYRFCYKWGKAESFLHDSSECLFSHEPPWFLDFYLYHTWFCLVLLFVQLFVLAIIQS